MATDSGTGFGEVKSISDSLECSPSQHQASSSIYSGSEDNVEAKKKTAKHKAGVGGGPESGFGVGRKKAIK